MTLLNVDAEFTSHEINRHEESPLDKLDLTEEFKPITYPTCKICSEDITFGMYYFYNDNIPYCKRCYDYLSQPVSELD